MIKKILITVILLVLALVGYRMLQPKDATNTPTTEVMADRSANGAFTSTDFDDIPPTYVDLEATSPSVSMVNPVLASQTTVASFSCDGRKHCSQMTSCAEATYFSNHCPNTKMDGNHDGIPCEKQWCK